MNTRLNPLHHPICLEEPRRLVLPDSWVQHIPLAMYLVDILKPRIIVELGTHTGNSYCAFCQAVDSLGLDTVCSAVDTWQGDLQAGFYGPEILEELREYHDPRYGDFSKLMQTTFDEAVGEFKNGSIDLLHIDGLHTYEAVSHDFETWLPKMSGRGVVIFHDIHVRRDDFDVWKVWEELREIYPGFDFSHGHGLGVLGVGKNQAHLVKGIFQMDGEEQLDFTKLFSGLGKRFEQELMITRNKEILSRKDFVIGQLESQNQQLESQNQQLENQNQQLENQNQQLENQNQQLENQNQQLENQKNIKEKLLAEAHQKLSQTRQELDQITSSKAWKLALALRRARKAVLPPDSLHTRLIRRMLSPIKGFSRSRKIEGDIALIRDSEFFNPEWYLREYPDVADAKMDPARHYLVLGGDEGRNPGPDFCSAAYLVLNPDVKMSNFNPLLHYLKLGKEEGRRISGDVEKIALETKAFTKIIPDSNISPVYHQYLMNAENGKSEHFFGYEDHEVENQDFPAKLIAFYLPQYHPIPENDGWWGKGFTEWTNVPKAVPNFIGHYQPRLPGELGFYDLRIRDVQQRQIELARNYGIYGFCFHYYWFDGRRLLERPLVDFLESQENDFPFCVCWANENWTRRWDGAEHDILLEQNYGMESQHDLIGSIIDLSRDSRYIRVNGKPLFVVYRVDLIPQIERVGEIWRNEFRKRTGEDVFLAAAQSFAIDDPNHYGFDAALEFPPHRVFIPEIDPNTVPMVNPGFAGKLYDYGTAAKFLLKKRNPDYKLFRTVMPSWDNTARKQNFSHIFMNSNPEIYKKWLKEMIDWTSKNLGAQERVIFINAWNEWGEGAYLEPDRGFGYAYLQATYQALKGD